MRKWRLVRSPHADVLSGIERAIAMHPAGGKYATRRTEPKNVTRVPREANGTDAA